MEVTLWPDAAHGSVAVRNDIVVSVDRFSPTSLRLRYLVIAPVEELVIPQPAPALRADNLWKTTCFEAFLAAEEESGYLELNFSPSTQWAAYDFADYRTGMVQASLPAPPEIEVDRGPGLLALTATVSLHLREERYRLGLAAVLEERGGHMSYWALTHAGDRPDFHRRDCFQLELPPPPRR